jgi:hypothetical protein
LVISWLGGEGERAVRRQESDKFEAPESRYQLCPIGSAVLDGLSFAQKIRDLPQGRIGDHRQAAPGNLEDFSDSEEYH